MRIFQQLGLASDKLLDTYQTERLPHVQEIVKLATRAFKIFKTRNPLIATIRNAILRLIQRWENPEKLHLDWLGYAPLATWNLTKFN